MRVLPILLFLRDSEPETGPVTLSDTALESDDPS